MKKIAKYISVAAIALSFSSCNDWMNDVPNKGSVDDYAVFQTEETVTLYVNGFYTWLNTYGQFGDRQFSGSWTEAMTDIFKYSGSNLTARAGQPNQYAELAVPMSPDGDLYSCWDNAYTCVRRINQFLVLEEKYASGYREDLRLKWQGQARFFRAFLNFQLAKRHGGSIIIYEGLPDRESKGRSSAEEVWDFIEKDLDFAIEVLPEVWEKASTGRVTKYAALALKSRIMLYAERWQKAFDAADQVIKSGKYGLVDEYAQAWKGHNKESILEFNYNKDLGP
ncbi:MAG: RagB/SusD family nutrient uptake outer membrane protein, partial [Muribaculaceae bacterium]|nr:RagB/SusD family nutrient uptake outer membrane protein [Muribaculaceae bacterium]